MSDQAPKPPSIIKRERVVLAGAEARPAARGTAAPACGKKSVRLLEHEGAPRAIEFTCTCGETTLVELVFESTPTAAKAGVPA